MKKGYVTYLVVGTALSVLLLFGLNRSIENFKARTEGPTFLGESGPVADPASVADAASAPVTEEPEIAIEHPTSAPTPKLETPVTGFAPSCANPGNLRQAVNPTPRGTPYKGQLLVSLSTGRRPGPCTRAVGFSNTGESYSVGTLSPGKYQLSYGTLTVH